jgi:RNA polymerase sigma-70 factor (ECF subfamily)
MDPQPPLEQARRVIADQMPMLSAYLRHLLTSPQDADDVMQEVCLLALEQPSVILRGDEPGAYLRGIARHLANRHHRRYRSHRTLDELVDRTWDEAESAAQDKPEQEVAALAACLKSLSARARQLLDQRYRDGLEAGRIGEQAGMSAEAVRMALMRARQALARCLNRRLETGTPS